MVEGLPREIEFLPGTAFELEDELNGALDQLLDDSLGEEAWRLARSASSRRASAGCRC